MILTATTHLLELKLGAATTTNAVEIFSAFNTLTTTTVTPETSSTTSNSTADVTVVGSPGASEQRIVKFISVYNADTVANTVTIKRDVSGTERRIGTWNLNAGDSLLYSDGVGWYVMNSDGARKQVNTIIAPAGNPNLFVAIDAANLTAVKTLTSNSSFAYYLGQAQAAYTSISLRYRVTTAAATITWAEVGIAYSASPVTLAGNATLTRLGYTDVSGTINSTGLKTTAVTVSGIYPGMHLWALFGNQATTAAVLRGALADDLTGGFFQSVAATRISTMGAATAFTVEGATTVPVWGYWQGT